MRMLVLFRRRFESLVGLILVSGLSPLAVAGIADIEGNVSYRISGDQVTIEIARIANNSQGTTTGTLHVTMRLTDGPDPYGAGYNVARHRITGNSNGRLGPREYFSDIRWTLDYEAPPAGTYYVHFFTSQHPETNTALDVVTFTDTLTVGTGSTGGIADIEGTVSYRISGDQVTIEIARIANNSRRTTTGTLRVTMRLTDGPDPYGAGYNVARHRITGDSNGRLGPREYFSDIRWTLDYEAPPAGTYYVHFFTSQHPNPETALDVRTFTSTLTIGGGTGVPPDGPTANPIDDFNVSIPSSCPLALRVCVRDHECEDGDQVRVSVNGGVVFSGEIDNDWQCRDVAVREGVNTVEMFAINGTGFKGACSYADANTGEIRITGGQNVETQSWSHRGGAGSTANLNVTVGANTGTCLAPVSGGGSGSDATPTTQFVILGDSGDTARIERSADGTYWIGDEAIGSGSVVSASNGDEYTLRLEADGTWYAEATEVPADASPATRTRLYGPRAVAVDGSGNVYIADPGSHRVRKVDPAGTITTFAGSRVDGYGGDGGPASQARLSWPVGVATDSRGNVYIADWGNHRLRRVDPAGTITTVAGTGERGYGGDGGPASQARLSSPGGVATDSRGSIYIADWGNNRVRKVDPAGTITTFAGSRVDGYGGDGGPASQARLSRPGGVATDSRGNVYIADGGNHRVRKVDPAGTITTVAGTGERGYGGDGGPASQARLSSPGGVATDSRGNVYIADGGNHRVRKVDPAGTITTVAGTGERGYSGDGGPAYQAQLSWLGGVATDSRGNVFFADGGNDRVRKVDPAGTITTFAGFGSYGGDGGPASQAQLSWLGGVATDSRGNVYFADGGNHRVRKVDPAGTITTVAGTGEQGYGGDGGPASQAQLSSPGGVATDSRGNVFFADWENHRVRKVDPAGTITTVAGTGEEGYGGDGGPASQALLSWPSGVATDSRGNVYFADGNNHRVRKVDPAGTITTVAGTGEQGYGGDGGPASQAQLSSPRGVATDSRGNLYIADGGNARVRKVDPAGTITTVAGTGGRRGYGGDGGPASQAQLFWPSGVATDSRGYVYITDWRNHRVRKVDPAGTITTVAGTGEQGYGGDGGPAFQARLSRPVEVAADSRGNLYIADRGNARVRKVDPAGTITTFAGSDVLPAGDDHGNSPAAATPLVLGMATGGRIETSADADYFRLEIGRRTAVAIYTAGDVDTVGSVFDSTGGLVASNDDHQGAPGLNFRIEVMLEAGVYYVLVQSWGGGTGSYTLHAE